MFDIFLSQVCFYCLERVLRAILLSAVKMSVFHAAFTWLVCSWFGTPLVFVPTVIAGLMALVPISSPVTVSASVCLYLWYNFCRFETDASC